MSPGRKHRDKKRHAAKQARKRYYMRIDRGDRRNISRLIKEGMVTEITEDSDRWSDFPQRKVYALHYRGKDMVVVYDSEKDDVVTFLPPKLLEGVEIKRGITLSVEG